MRLEPQAGGGPRRVLPEQRVGARKAPREHAPNVGVVTVTDVAECHQRVPAQIPRIARRDVPPAVCGEQFDGEGPHGPEELIELPARFLSVTAYGDRAEG